MAWELEAGVEAADDLLAEIYGIEKATLDPLKPKDYEKIVQRIAKSLHGAAAPVEAKAVQSALGKLNVNWSGMGAEARAKVIDEASKYLGKPVVDKVIPPVQQQMAFFAKDVIATTKAKTVLKYDLNIGVDMGATDERIAKYVVASQGHFVRDALGQRSEAFSSKAKAIVASGVERGLGSAAISERLNDVLGIDAGRSQDYWTVIAMVFANRARTMTQIASYGEAGIVAYVWEAILDEVTSVQCRFLHGRRFPVKSAMANFQAVEDADSPEMIKSVQPFMQFGKVDGKDSLYYGTGDNRTLVANVTENAVGQKDKVGAFANGLDDDKLAKAGILAPPIHARCRSTVVPEFGSAPAGTVYPKAPPAPSPADMKPKPTPAQAAAKAVSRLNELVDEDGMVSLADCGVTVDESMPWTSALPDPDSLNDLFELHGASKKPKLDDLVFGENFGDAANMKKLATSPKYLDAQAEQCRVVVHKGKLYVVNGEEALVVQKMLGQIRAYAKVLDLDALPESAKLPKPKAPAPPPPPPPKPPTPAPAPPKPPPPPASAHATQTAPVAPPGAPPGPMSADAQQEAAKKLKDMVASGPSHAGAVVKVKDADKDPPYAGGQSWGALDPKFDAAKKPASVKVSALTFTYDAFPHASVKELIDDPAKLKAAWDKVKVIECEGKHYVYGGQQAVLASKLLGYDAIPANVASLPKHTPPPPVAMPAAATAAPTPGVAKPVVPGSQTIGIRKFEDLPTKPLPRARVAPGGMTESDFEATARTSIAKRVEKATSSSRDAIKAFSDGEYGGMRDAQRLTEEQLRAKHSPSSADRYKKLAAQAEDAFGKVPPSPGTVYRGIRGLPREVIDKFMQSDVIDMECTSSTSWDPNVSIGFMGGAGPGGSDYKTFFVIKHESGIPIQTISNFRSEREILMSKDAKFQVTGRYRAEENGKKILIVEMEEIKGAKKPK